MVPASLTVPPMSDHDDLVYVRRAERSIPELSCVALLVDVVTLEGETVPAGSEGTVVGIWGGGEAYEVEFLSPTGVATVRADDLRRL